MLTLKTLANFENYFIKETQLLSKYNVYLKRFLMQIKYFLSIMVVLFLGCDKNNAVNLSENTFTAQREKETWNGITSIRLTADNELIFVATGNGLDNGFMVVAINFDGIGVYTLNDEDGTYYNTLGGDAVIAKYGLVQGDEGTFLISDYDVKSNSMEGTFELPLKAIRLSNPETNDITLSIANGRFKGTIQD